MSYRERTQCDGLAMQMAFSAGASSSARELVLKNSRDPRVSLTKSSALDLPSNPQRCYVITRSSSWSRSPAAKIGQEMSASPRALLTTRETNTGKKGNPSSQANKANLSPIRSTPVDQISFLQRTVGNRGVERLLKSGLIQAKLKVNEPGDIYEKEADRIAGQVLATPTYAPVGGTAQGIRRVSGQPVGRDATAPTSVEHALASAGRPLEPALRQDMEQRFGHGFSRVRVHTGTAAEQSARDANARAYTVGHNMVFDAGQFAPGTNEGRRLLAHELTHVVQQLGAEGMNVAQSNDKRPLSVIGLVRHPPESAAPTGVPAAVLDLPSSAGNRAVAGPVTSAVSSSPLKLARAPGDPLGDEIKAAEQELEAEKEVAEDFLEELGWAWPKGPGEGRIGGRRTVGQLVDRLRRIAREGGEKAQEAGRIADELQASRRKIGDLHRRRGTTGAPAKKAEYAGAEFETGVEAEHAAGKSGTATKSAAKTTGTATGAGTKTFVKAEETAIKAEMKLGSRLATGAGRFGLSLLLPGPEDAILLMVQFAGSYAEALEAIRDRNTRTGFATGLSGLLLGRSQRALRGHFVRRSPARDLETRMLGAVGIAEKAHSTGLDAGFKYGELLSDDAKDALREIGFSALRVAGNLPERQQLFAEEGVRRLGVVLEPTVDQIFEAMRMRAEEQERAELKKMKRESGTVGMKS